MTTRHRGARFAIACAAATTAMVMLIAGAPLHSQGVPAPKPVWPPALTGPAQGEVEVLPVKGNVYMISGAGANITVQIGEQGIFLVDTGIASMSEKVWAAVRNLSKGKLRYVVNTSDLPDHIGGNATIAAKGEIVPLRERNYNAGPMGTIEYNRASVIAYLTVLGRMSAPTGQVSPTPPAAWPDNTYATPLKRLSFNDEPVVIMHETANTDGNSVVLFRRSDVVSAGDLVDLTSFPVIDLKAGGSVQGMIAALNHLIDTTVPEAHAAGGTMVIPGHGRLADHAEVAYYRDMVTIVRDRVEDLMKKRMTLAQIKAAHPGGEYEPRYGHTTGAWTTDMFIEATYRSLMQGQAGSGN